MAFDPVLRRLTSRGQKKPQVLPVGHFVRIHQRGGGIERQGKKNNHATARSAFQF
jgi:hypothetical protein